MKNIDWKTHIEYLIVGMLGTLAIAIFVLIGSLIHNVFGDCIKIAAGVVSTYAFGYFIKNWLK